LDLGRGCCGLWRFAQVAVSLEDLFGGDFAAVGMKSGVVEDGLEIFRNL